MHCLQQQTSCEAILIVYNGEYDNIVDNNINVNHNAVNDVVMTAGNMNNDNNNDVKQDKTRRVLDRTKIQVEYQSYQKFVLYQSIINSGPLLWIGTLSQKQLVSIVKVII